MSVRMGVDVGGTFTDIVCFDEERGRLDLLKVPSTPAEPHRAVVEGAARILEEAGLDRASVDFFIHGTTVATNTILERKGARVALHTGVHDPVEGCILGVDTTERQTGDGVVHVVLLSVMLDTGEVRQFDLHQLASLQIELKRYDDALQSLDAFERLSPLLQKEPRQWLDARRCDIACQQGHHDTALRHAQQLVVEHHSGDQRNSAEHPEKPPDD